MSIISSSAAYEYREVYPLAAWQFWTTAPPLLMLSDIFPAPVSNFWQPGTATVGCTNPEASSITLTKLTDPLPISLGLSSRPGTAQS
jgi:hypothetical protein